MKSKRILLGMLVLVLAFGMTVVGCDDDDSDDSETSTTVDNNGDNNGNSGTTGDPALTGTVSISGTAKVGQTLTANTGSLGGSGTISYQWKRGDANNAVNSTIYNATGNSYLLTTGDFNKFIAVTVTRSGYSGSITSTVTAAVADVMVWTQSSPVGGLTNVNGVAYNGTNLWLAVGDYRMLLSSSDGEIWTRVLLSGAFPVPITEIGTKINGIAYGNGKWIAVGGFSGGGQIAVSDDGSTWTAVANSQFGSSAINSIAYGNNLWIAVGASGKMATSTDGQTWTTVTSTFGSSAINSIAYGNNLWIAVGAAGKMATSTDGQTWTDVNVASIFNYAILTVAYANNQWIAAGDGGKMATSVTGQSWTAVTGSPFQTFSIKSIAYGNNKWVAVAGMELLGAGISPFMIAFSTDGNNWTSVANTTFVDNTRINGIAFGNNKWVAVGDDSSVAYANDN